MISLIFAAVDYLTELLRPWAVIRPMRPLSAIKPASKRLIAPGIAFLTTGSPIKLGSPMFAGGYGTRSKRCGTWRLSGTIRSCTLRPT